MPKKKNLLQRFATLTWNDLGDWAGETIVSRARTYQRQGRVSGLAVTADGSLVGWVDGAERYACKVVIDADGKINSRCTCPYMFDCKHGVAMVFECLEELEENRIIPEIKANDERLEMVADSDRNGDLEMDYGEDVGASALPKNLRHDFDGFLKDKSRDQLIDLIYDLARQFPEMAQEVAERQQMIAGKSEVLVQSLRREIKAVSSEPGWGNHWDNDGFTPDYSGISESLKGCWLRAMLTKSWILGAS